MNPTARITCLVGLAALAVASVSRAQELDRSKIPPPGKTPTIQAPEVQRQTLPNGLEIWTVSRHELPVINAVLVIKAGAAQDGTQPGLADVTAGLLDEGSGERSALEFTRAYERYGIQLSTSVEADRTTITLQSLSATADSAFAFLGELVSKPAFSVEEVERDRKSRLTALAARKDQPVVVATRVFEQAVYGADHAYGHAVDGTIASITALTRDDITDFYRRYYRANNALLMVVGDVSPTQAAELARPAFERWQGGETITAATTSPAPIAPPVKARTVLLVDKPGAAQSEIRIGHAGAARSSDPDYYALQVMNLVLGGQFYSRINLNIREKQGYTYGARSAWSYRRGPGPFMASAGVVTAKTDSALVEFFRELEDIVGSRPATPEEVEFAKGAIVRAYPRRIETNQNVASELADLAFFGMPASEISEYQQKIGAVTPADVNRVAEKYLHPEHFITVVVGDLARIRPSIEALNLGQVTVVDPDGRPAERATGN
jgi:zinc protease